MDADAPAGRLGRVPVMRVLGQGGSMRRTALVTGASSNIGQGIALRLAQDGYEVFYTYNTNLEGAQKTEQMIQDVGGVSHYSQASLEMEGVPQRVVDEARAAMGGIDLVVCNAGKDRRDSIMAFTSKDAVDLYRSNFLAYMLVAGASARAMVEDGVKGSIIFITSSRAEQSYPDDFLYGGLKAAVKRACESVAMELSDYGIRVNCVAPGATLVRNEKTERAHTRPFVRESIPLRRMGSPEDIGAAVAFLASPDASYITGITLRVDGGLILPGMKEGYDAIPWRADR